MLIKRILPLMIVGIVFKAVAMDDENKNQISKEYMHAVMAEASTLASTLNNSETSTMDQWIHLFKTTGKLECLIECGFIKEKEAKQDILQGIEHLDAAFKMYVKTEQKKPVLALTQLAVSAFQNFQTNQQDTQEN